MVSQGGQAWEACRWKRHSRQAKKKVGVKGGGGGGLLSNPEENHAKPAVQYAACSGSCQTRESCCNLLHAVRGEEYC